MRKPFISIGLFAAGLVVGIAYAQQAAPPPAAAAQIDPTKEADIRRLLEVMDASNLMTQVLSSSLQPLRDVISKMVPATDRGRQFSEDFMKRFQSNFHTEDLLNGLIPVYDKYLTDEDIKTSIAFYQTPPGKHYLKSLPYLLHDSQEVGRRLGEEAGRKAMEDTMKDYPDLFPKGSGGPGIR
jgi:hypothetical protein